MSPYFQKTLLFIALLVGAQSFAFDVPRTGGKKCALVAHVAADQKSAQTIQQMLVGAENGRLYPRSLPRTEGNHIMFGFESEFTSLQWTQLLSIYMPRAEFGINKESWQNMSAEDRVTWVKNRAKQMKAGDKDIGLVLMEGAALNGQAVPEFMAKKIILDETGNLEIMLTKIADFYDGEVDNAVKAMTSLIEPVIICVMGVVIGSIVICMFLPIFQMSALIDKH